MADPGNINSGGAIVDNGTLAYNRTDGGAALALAVTGTGGISQIGSGTTTLNSVLQYTGTTAVYSGNLTLGTAGNFNASSGLLMGGGTQGNPTLTIATGRSSSVSLNGATFNSGNDTLSIGGNLGSGDSLSLGAITRNTGSLINFGSLPTTGTVTTTTINANPAGGQQTILNGGSVVNLASGGYTWAVSGSGATAGTISGLPFASMTAVNGGALIAGADISLGAAGATTAVTSGVTINSLYYNFAAPGLTINSGGSLVIATGGVLIGANEGANNLTLSGGGTLTSGNGTDLVLIDGSGAANAFTVNPIITDNGSTSIGLTVARAAGTMNVTLDGSNTFSGDTNINANSSITLANAMALQNSSLNYAANSGTLSFGTLTNATFGGLKGSGNLALTNTAAASVALTVGNNNNSTGYSGVLSGSGASLTKVGSGTLTLSSVNTYTGPTVITAGGLSLISGGSIASSSSFNIASGAILSTTGTLALTGTQSLTGAGSILGAVSLASGTKLFPGNGTVGTLSFDPSAFSSGLNLSSGSAVNYYLGTPGTSMPGVGSLIAVNGNLTLPSSGLALNLNDYANANGSGGSIGGGLYELFSYTGSLTGFNASTTFGPISDPALPGRTYTFTNPSGQVDVLISSPALALTWTGKDGGTGAVDSVWSNGSQTNWASGSSPHSYSDPDNVTFGDNNAVSGSGITNSTVTIAASGVTPATVVFSNSSVNYTILNASGSVGIGGTATTITKTGTALVNLQGSNSFAGPVAINAGAINISNPAALGTSSGVTVFSGAALQMQNNISVGSIPLSIAGTGLASIPAGALDNVSGTNSYGGPVTLSSDATIQSDSGSLTLSAAAAVTGTTQNLTLAGAGNGSITGNISSGTGSLTKSGAGTWALSGTNSYSGGTTLNAGVLNVNGDAALGAAGTGVTFAGNATLQAGASSVALNRSISIGAGTTATLDTNGNNMSVNAISGSSSNGLTKVGGGSLTLKGANSYAGNTVVSGGTLVLSQAVSVPGAVVQIDASTLSSGYTSVGNLGTGGGSFTAGTSLPALSSSTATMINGHQALVFNGAATLASSNAYTNTGNQVTLFMVEQSNNAAGYSGELSFIGPNGGTDWNVNGNLAVEDDASGANIRPIVANNQNPAELGRSAGTPLVWDTVLDTSAGTGVSRLTNSSGGTTTASGTETGSVPFNINQMGIGGRYNGGVLGGSFSGEIGEVLVYNTALTTAQTQAVESYLDSKWLGIGIGSGNLPSTTGLQIAGGATVDLNGLNQQVASLANSGGTGGTITSSAAGAPTLTLTPTGTTTFGGTIQNGAGTVGLTISGSGTQILNGSNSYSGPTSVSAGTLQIGAGGSLGSTTVTVLSGATLAATAGSGSISVAGSLSLNNGSFFNMSDGAIGTLNITGGGTALHIGSGTGAAANMTFDLASTGADQIVDSSAAAVLGTNTINIAAVGTSLSNGSYPLISATGGLTGNFEFSNGLTSEHLTVGSTTYSLSLNNSGTLESISVQVPGITAIWAGTGSTTNTTAFATGSNWSTKPTVPGSIGTTNNLDTIEFNSSPTNLSPTVDTGRNIQSILFDTSSVGAVNLTGSALTLSANGTIQTTASVTNNQTISTALVLEGNYGALSGSTSGATLKLAGNISAAAATAFSLGGVSNGTISGAISGSGGTALSLVKSGTGTWFLTNPANSYQGGTSLNSGTLNFVSGSLGSTGAIAFNGGSLQYAAGNTQDISSRINNSTAPISIDTNGNASVTFASSLSNGNTGGLTKLGTGTLALTASNAFTGPISINIGALAISNSGSLGASSGVTVASGAALQMMGGISTAATPLSIAGTGVASAPAGALDSVSGTNTYSGTLTLASDAAIQSDAGSITLSAPTSVSGSGQNLTLSGAANGTISGSIATGGGAVTLAGGGTWTFSGSNSYSGGTTLNAGALNINSDASLGAAPSLPATSLTFAGNSTLQAGASSLVLNANRNVAIAGSTTATFDTVSGNSITIGGTISGGDGASAVAKINAGTLVLSGSNSYAGGTTISGGTVSITQPTSLGTGNVNLTGTAPTLQIAAPVGTTVNGFGGASNSGWSLNRGFETNPPPTVNSSNVLTITNNNNFENRSAFYSTPVSYGTGFSTSFVYQDSSSSPGADGMTFTLENDTRGAGAFGAFGRGALGYGPGGQTNSAILNSAAFGWSVRNGPATTESTIVSGSNGTVDTNYITTGGVNLASGDPILFDITGIGTSNTLNVTLTDETTSATYMGSVTLTGSLASLVGNSGSAYIGFTGSNTETNSTQTISNFSYTPGFSGTFAASNNITVNANSTIDVSYDGGASLGNLSIGTNILTFTNQIGGGARLTMGSVTVNGNPTFSPASGVQANLGSLNDNGITRTITIAGGSATGTIGLTSGGSLVSTSLVQVSSGTLEVNNGTSGSATGSALVNVSSGALVGGNGTIGGMLMVASGGSLFVGSANNVAGKTAGTLYIGSGSNLLGSTLLDLTGPSTADEVIVGGGSGSVTLGGTLDVTSPNAFTFAGGQTFNLLGFGSESHSFSSVVLPTLSGSLSWNTTQLYTTGTISITGGGVTDIGSGYEIIHNGNLTSTSTQAGSGYNKGGWNGSTGIVSSTAAADTRHLTAVGVIQNSTDGMPTGPVLHSTWEGQSAVNTDVLVKYTYYGDTNLDGIVDGTDYGRIDFAYIADRSYLASNPGGTSQPYTGWYNGDFNYDGMVDGSDYTLMDNAFNQQNGVIAAELASSAAIPTAEIAGSSGISAVPEPTTLGLLGIGAIGLLGRRRRRV